MPISLHVLIILSAISPRLAISIFLNKVINLKIRKFENLKMKNHPWFEKVNPEFQN